MQDFDVGAIVPSTRDLIQVLGTRRRSLALVGLIDGASPAEDAARLDDLGVSSIAFVEAGPSMTLAARATRTMPALLVAPITDRDGSLRARFYGADGVAIEAGEDADAWDALAKGARATRMAPLAFARDAGAMARAIKAGARAVLVEAETAEAVIAIANAGPRNTIVVAHVVNGDADAIRALLGKVDAAVVPPAVHRSATFRALVADVDP